jgi:hypothetical protein
MTVVSAGMIRDEYSPDHGVQFYRVALDLPYWVMHSASYRLIRMAIEMASEVGAFFLSLIFLFCITVAKRPCHGPLKIKQSYIIVL